MQHSPQVPALEHNNEVRGESLDLIKYIDSNFEGPSLSPDVRVKDSITCFQSFVFLHIFNACSVIHRIPPRKNFQKSCFPTLAHSIKL